MKVKTRLISDPRFRLLIFLLLSSSIVALSVLAAIYTTFPGDEKVLEAFHEIETSWLTSAARNVTQLGSAAVIAVSILALGTFLWITGRRRDAMGCAFIALAELSGLGIKELVGRPRPDFILLSSAPASAAFPSGHAIHSVLFFGFLIHLCWFHMGSTRLRAALQGFIALSILTVSASRIYLGVHWPSDVLGGYLYGAFFLWILIWAVRGHRFGLLSKGRD